MIYKLGIQSAFLVCGLILPLPATAQEEKAPAAVPKAEKPAPSAAATPKAETPAAAKPAAPVAAVAQKQVEPATPLRARVRAGKSVAPQRVAVAFTPERRESPAHDPGKIAAETHAATNAPHALHWSYEGETGPQAWARLAPEFAKCATGERQSPINIRDGMKLDLEQVTFDYRPSAFRVIDNGHTIQANVNGWNSLRVMGRRFRLVQFHFHSPAEEMIDGRQYDMVVHLVHKDGEGRLAVVAVLVETGARQPAIQNVLNNLPLEKGVEVAGSTNLDLIALLPENRKYFTYMGSLTTPPCSEDVLWIVMKQPVQATAEQLNLFARMYPMNARPIQASSGRVIKESN